MSNPRLPHLIVEGFTSKAKFTTPPSGGGGDKLKLPQRDPVAHGALVRAQLDQVQADNVRARGATDPVESPPISIEVQGKPGFSLAVQSLESRSDGVVVATSRTEGETEIAAVHIPPDGLAFLTDRVDRYSATPEDGERRHRGLIESIESITLAGLRSFWADDGPFPAADVRIWWEVWLCAIEGEDVWEVFVRLAKSRRMPVAEDVLRFPDRVVGLVFSSAEEMDADPNLLDLIGEVRRARENPAPFLALPPREQAEWVRDLMKRVVAPPATAPAVCLLDRGVARHVLLQPAIEERDLHRANDDWQLTDHEGHGTEMAGVALYGERLADLLAGSGVTALHHRLESVKILPTPPRTNPPKQWGSITKQGVSRVEIAAPQRPRVFCMAVTHQGSRTSGRPSAWSGALDQLCSGVGDGHRRLFFVSAGNSDANERHRFPDSNDTDQVEDPAQAWNAVTVGASTSLIHFDGREFPGCRPIAERGDLSPSSRTSVAWPSGWPYKPDFLMEGGNQIVDGLNRPSDPDSMALLTTGHAAFGSPLVNFRDTSAATALAARAGALLQAEYPNLWPETLRALLVHSAEWTERMDSAFGGTKLASSLRLRRYGYGIADLDRARYSARDSLTLVVQDSIQPFDHDDGRVKTREMALHTLPWPEAQLAELGWHPVVMRVTLSYFIEPKPGRREKFAKRRHDYQSHSLNFEVRRPLELLDAFQKRVNKADREEGAKFKPIGDSSGWRLGPVYRERGSIRSDWWEGTAQDLAACGVIAVFPSGGWWKEAPPREEHWKKRARYALVVSIRPGKQAVDLFTERIRSSIDLYTPVAEKIRAAVKPVVQTEVST